FLNKNSEIFISSNINQSFIFAIDPPQCSAYDARADQFCQSVLADRLPKCTKNTFFGVMPLVPLMEEREWDTLGCAGFLGISLLTLFRFATIIMSNEWA
ncbi:hypothetical protein ACN4A1_06900, partial [Acinetobacter baumannii]|uniref:hypothetical protein n=1 Tax=Acinetobacter baumannii TaxID=470 RepID=UPI003D0A8307